MLQGLYLFYYLFIFITFTCLFIYLFIYLSIYLFACLFVCLFVSLLIDWFNYLFIRKLYLLEVMLLDWIIKLKRSILYVLLQIVYFLKVLNVSDMEFWIFLIGIHSVQGQTVTKRHGITRRRSTKMITGYRKSV